MKVVAILITAFLLYAAHAVYKSCKAMEKALQEEQFKMLFKE